MTKINRRKFIRITTLLPIAGSILGISCVEDELENPEIKDKVASLYKISDTTKTTLTETIKASTYTKDKTIIGSDIDLMLKAGYGDLTIGEGEPHKLRKDMLKTASTYKEAVNRKSLLIFPQITDVHLTDIEGPDRMVWAYYMYNDSAYRANSIYCTHILDAMIQTFSALHEKENFDFVLATGDLSDNASAIEVMWFNTALNGGVITADTGKIDDPIKGNSNDFTDPYIAKGLPEGLEWYVAVGNHDVLHQGVNFITDKVAEHHVGDKILKQSYMCTEDQDIYVGTQDGSTKYGDPKCAFDKLILENGSATPYIVSTGSTCTEDPDAKASCKDDNIVADPRRKAFRNHKEWFDTVQDADIELSNKTADKCGYYTVQPKEDIPIELIFLDFAAVKENFMDDENFKPLKMNFDGFLESEQFNWLKSQLDRLKNEKKGAIITMHHPIETLTKESEISKNSFIGALQEYDNILAVISGHTHINKFQFYEAVKEVNSFVQIVTCSLLDFPEQARIYELVYNDNKTVSIFTTMLNHASAPGSFSDLGRKLSLAQVRVINGNIEKGLGKVEDRNAEIVVPIPEYLQNEFEKITTAKDYIRTLKFDK